MANTKKQFFKNSLSGVALQMSSAIASFIRLPILIYFLGKEGYGVFQLAQSVLHLAMLLNLGMSVSLVRFFSQATVKGDRDELKSLFSTSQFCLGGMGFLAALFMVCLAPFFPDLMKIDPSMAHETVILIFCLAIVLFFDFQTFVYRGILLGGNRYDIANGVVTVTNLSRISLIVLVFSCIYSSIVVLGIIMAVMAILNFAAIFFFTYRKFGEIVFFSFKHVKKKLLFSLFSFSLITMTASVAFSASMEVPNLIIGRNLGTAMVTYFAPALTVASFSSALLLQISNPLVPLASRDAAMNEGKNLKSWAILLSQFVTAISCCFTLPLCVFGPELITLWLGEDMSHIWILVAIYSFAVIATPPAQVLYLLSLGAGSILPHAISQVVVAVVIITLVFLGTSFWGWNLLTVVIVIAICRWLRNGVYMVYAYSKQFSFGYFNYCFHVFVKPMTVLGGMILLGLALKNHLLFDNTILILLEVLFLSCVHFVLTWFFLFDPKIKRFVTFQYACPSAVHPPENGG